MLSSACVSGWCATGWGETEGLMHWVLCLHEATATYCQYRPSCNLRYTVIFQNCLVQLTTHHLKNQNSKFCLFDRCTSMSFFAYCYDMFHIYMFGSHSSHPKVDIKWDFIETEMQGTAINIIQHTQSWLPSVSRFLHYIIYEHHHHIINKDIYLILFKMMIYSKWQDNWSYIVYKI